MACMAFLAAGIFLWLLAAAALPFLALRDHRLAVTRQRSLYDKSAGQLRHLAVWMQALAFVALGADVLLDGALARFAAGPLSPPLRGMTLGAGAAALLMLGAFLLLRRNASSCAGAALCGLSGLCALGSAVMAAILLWCRLRGLSEWPQTAAGSNAWASLLALLKVQVSAAGPVLPILSALFCLALTGAAGQGAALAWHLIRRRADDFGRDYYAFVVAVRSRKAMYAGACVLPFSAVLLWVTGMLPARGTAWSFGAAWWAWYAGTLGLPLAVACWYVMARSQAPLRLKFWAFLALPLLWAGTVCLLVRLAA